MEIEAKFTIQDTQTYEKLQALDSIGPFVISASHLYAIHDTYLDTPDCKILAAGYACRRRDQNGQCLITLKALQGSGGAIHRREEWETNLPTTTPLPLSVDQWPDSDVKQRILALSGSAPLTPLFSLAQRRLTRSVQQGQRLVAELSLDTVTLLVNGTREPSIELEIEIKGQGTVADLQAILDRLADMPGLVAEPLSKFERGLAAINTALPGLTPEDTIAEAARKTLRLHLLRMLINEAGTRAGKDTEALHDMRVATRRMRTALRVFAATVNAVAMKPYLKGLQRTGRLLGRVRDLDVFREKAQAYLNTFPKNRQPDLYILCQAWNVEYEYARHTLLDYLDGRRYAHFKGEFAALLAEPFPPAMLTLPYAARRATEVIPALLDERLAEFYTCRIRLAQPDAALTDYHQMRIVTKNLRYTLEYFRELLGAEVGPAIEALKTLQNHLGALQDAVVAGMHLHHVLAWGTWTPPAAPELRWTQTPPRAPDVAAYLAFCQAEIRRLVGTFPEAWQRFEGTRFAQLLTNALAVLPPAS